MAEARNEKSQISGGAGRILINKTSPRGVAERDLRNKTAGARSENALISALAKKRVFALRPAILIC
jgi:hypothetical protein